MDRFAAHYIFTGQDVLRKAVLAKNDQGKIVSLSEKDAMAIEYSNTIFFNGIICPGFVSFKGEKPDERYTLLHTRTEVPSQYIKPENLLVQYAEDDIVQLFTFLSSLQLKLGYTIIDLLKVLTVNNYKAQAINLPIIKVGNIVPLNLLLKLNLVEGIFTPKTHIKIL